MSKNSYNFLMLNACIFINQAVFADDIHEALRINGFHITESNIATIVAEPDSMPWSLQDYVNKSRAAIDLKNIPVEKNEKLIQGEEYVSVMEKAIGKPPRL